MKYAEENTPFGEMDNENDNGEINHKQKKEILRREKMNNNTDEEKNNYSFLFYLNNFLDLLRPSKNIQKKDLDMLNIIFPLCFFVILIIIKFFTSKNLTIYYLGILIMLPICLFILINKIIIENYFDEFSFSDIINKLFKDFFKLFIISIFPLTFIQYLSFIVSLSSIVGTISNILSIIYSAYIAQKLFLEYIKNLSINYDAFIMNEKNKILFIYLIIYSLISYIINI